MSNPVFIYIICSILFQIECNIISIWKLLFLILFYLEKKKKKKKKNNRKKLKYLLYILEKFRTHLRIKELSKILQK